MTARETSSMATRMSKRYRARAFLEKRPKTGYKLSGHDYDGYEDYADISQQEKERPKDSPNKSKQSPLIGVLTQSLMSNRSSDSLFVDVGLRQDYLLQRCGGTSLKYSFPDVDYAFLGYDLMKGYPHAIGSDPGFTFPIFRADYSEHQHTGDCRFSVPRGLVVIPDVSCVVSFSSSVVKSAREFEQSLSVSASVSAGGWGVQFSASAGYQKASSEISKKEYVYIISKATCNYYKSKLQDGKTPPFDPTFLHWIHKLNNSDSVGDYLDFFTKYGTHYPTEMTFGARFMKEHKMQSNDYETKQSQGINVAVQASYSGLFSAGGGFNLDSSQRQQASDFSKSVETTTITIGAAPPADGEANTWAATVQSNPVPSSYTLDTIENVFSEEYMGHLDVDYQRIRASMAQNKFVYWGMLQRAKGSDDFSYDTGEGIVIPNWYTEGDYRDERITFTDCVNTCQQLGSKQCDGISFCKNCIDRAWSICTIFRKSRNQDAFKFDERWQTIVYNGKLTLRDMTVADTTGNALDTKMSYVGSDSSAYGKAVNECDEGRKTFSNAKSYSYGMVFNTQFLLCKIYGDTKTLSLAKRKGFTTYIQA
ncbi:PV21-like protein [Mya arenaria]|uniref:PV21-like protein n=1 Tax=Mya arenaria TaxID=6604 RepID=A0ABY7GBP3_MYAAR|nr:PV21-like protein [Mya arenaria]